MPVIFFFLRPYKGLAIRISPWGWGRGGVFVLFWFLLLLFFFLFFLLLFFFFFFFFFFLFFVVVFLSFGYARKMIRPIWFKTRGKSYNEV